MSGLISDVVCRDQPIEKGNKRGAENNFENSEWNDIA
jgi:hypothetical protein